VKHLFLFDCTATGDGSTIVEVKIRPGGAHYYNPNVTTRTSVKIKNIRIITADLTAAITMNCYLIDRNEAILKLYDSASCDNNTVELTNLKTEDTATASTAATIGDLDYYRAYNRAPLQLLAAGALDNTKTQQILIVYEADEFAEVEMSSIVKENRHIELGAV